MSARQSLLTEIQSLKASYVRNGGYDTSLLAQIADLERAAAAAGWTAPSGARHTPASDGYSKSEVRLRHERCSRELEQLERQVEEIELKNKLRRTERSQLRSLAPSEISTPQSYSYRNPVVPSKSADIRTVVPYDAWSGFSVFYDFIVGLPSDATVVQLYAGLRDGTGVYLEPSVLPPVYTRQTADSSAVVMLGILQPVERCPADPGMCVIIELQTSATGGTARLESCAWAKLPLFDMSHEFPLLAGRWRIPFRQLPIDTVDGDGGSTMQYGHVELYVRVVHTRNVEGQFLASYSREELSRYQLLVASYQVKDDGYDLLEVKQEPEPETTTEKISSLPLQKCERLETVGFQIDRVKHLDRGECMIRLTAYRRSTGHVAQCSTGPVTCITTPVVSNVLRHRHVFGQQEGMFSQFPLSSDLVLVVRAYLKLSDIQKLNNGHGSACQLSRDRGGSAVGKLAATSSTERRPSSHGSLLPRRRQPTSREVVEVSSSAEVEEGFMLVAWTSLPLVIRVKGHYVFNAGTHVLPLYRAPVPDVSLMIGDVTSRDELCERCGHSSVKLHVFVGEPRRSSLTASEESDPDDENGEELGEPFWVPRKRNRPLTEPFTTGDGFDIYIDGCRHLPDAVTISRVAARVMDRHYTKVGHDMSATAQLDSSVHNPVYAFRDEFREPNLPPTSTLLFKLFTVDRFMKSLVIVGYAVLNVFVETGTERQPITDTGVQISLNEGGHQLRLYHEVPDGSKPFAESCLHGKRLIPCATLLVRLHKAATGPSGRTLQSAQVPESDWAKVGLWRSMPRYSDAAYYSMKCEPSDGERLLFRSLQARPATSIHDAAIALSKDRVDVGKDIEHFIRVQLNRLLDKIPDDMDLTFVSPYIPKYGIKFALDEAINLPWSNFTHAHFCFNPPAAYYLGLRKKVHDKLTFTQKLDITSTTQSPMWTDGFVHFRHRLKHPYLALIIHLKELGAVRAEDGYKYKLLSQAWTAVQVLNSGYVCTAYYQLPLIEGAPSLHQLEQLASQPVKDWLKAGIEANTLQLVNGTSVKIRLCDGRRDLELPFPILDQSQLTVDTSYLPSDILHQYKKQPGGKPLTAIVPPGKDPEEFIVKLGKRFRNYVYKLFHDETTPSVD